MGHNANSAIPALIDALKDDNASVRVRAVRALTRIGPYAKEAIPALTDALKDEKNFIPEDVAGALRRIRGGAAE